MECSVAPLYFKWLFYPFIIQIQVGTARPTDLCPLHCSLREPGAPLKILWMLLPPASTYFSLSCAHISSGLQPPPQWQVWSSLDGIHAASGPEACQAAPSFRLWASSFPPGRQLQALWRLLLTTSPSSPRAAQRCCYLPRSQGSFCVYWHYPSSLLFKHKGQTSWPGPIWGGETYKHVDSSQSLSQERWSSHCLSHIGSTSSLDEPTSRPGHTWGADDLDVVSQDYLLCKHDWRALQWLGVCNLTDHNLLDTDVSNETRSDLMWRDLERHWPFWVITTYRSNLKQEEISA